MEEKAGDTGSGVEVDLTALFWIFKDTAETEYFMRRRLGAVLAAVLLLSALAGCRDEKLEDELAYRQVGINNMDNGNYEEAVLAFNTALEQRIGKITETELDICYYRIEALYASGDMAGAMESVQALLDYDEKNGKAYFLRGCFFLEQGDSTAALSDYQNAVKYCAKDYELYIEIYERLSAYNLVEEGKEYLNQALNKKGSSADDSASRGRIYYLLGDYTSAQTELESAVEENVRANLYLAQVYDALEDTAKAEEYYQAYLASGEADSAAMSGLASIEMQKGNYSNALNYINQGLAMEEVTNRRELLYQQIIAYEYTCDFAGAWNSIVAYAGEYPDSYNADEKLQREYIFLENRQGVKEQVTEPESSE